MAEGRLSLPVARGWGETARRDLWWLQPLAVVLGFSAFIVYSTWAALQAAHYYYDPYLSPFYSPLIFEAPGREEMTGHAWFGAWPAWLAWMPALLATPAAFILWGPGLFRFTCYYYRGAYYKAFWADPTACAVGEPRKSYWGERYLPLILQNAHRYFMYVAVIFIALLAWDVYQALWFKGPDGARHFGVGVGTLVLAVNVVLLGGYTFGCHSLRHLVGGGLDQLSRAPARHTAYNCVSCLNRRHGLWAWASLFSVGFSDVYVRLCSMGVWHDYRILFT